MTMSVVRSDHCSVNIGDGVVVTGNYPESNTVNMWVNVDGDGDALRNPYLIFVIFFTLAKFLENKIYTKKRQFFALNL